MLNLLAGTYACTMRYTQILLLTNQRSQGNARVAIISWSKFELACQLVEDCRRSKAMKLVGFASDLADRSCLVAMCLGIAFAASVGAQWTQNAFQKLPRNPNGRSP